MSNQKPIFTEKDLLDELSGKISFAQVPDKWMNIQGTFERVKTHPEIEGVSVIELPDFRTQTNLFAEMARLDKDNKLESAPQVEAAQWSYSTFPPNAPKAGIFMD